MKRSTLSYITPREEENGAAPISVKFKLLKRFQNRVGCLGGLALAWSFISHNEGAIKLARTYMQVLRFSLHVVASSI